MRPNLFASFVAAGTCAAAFMLTSVAPATALESTCGTAPKNPSACEYFKCFSGTWELQSRSAGTTCNDNDQCTYNDVCDGFGTCRGSLGCVPSGPCETCNGSASCGKLQAGTPCPSSPTQNPCEVTCDGQSAYCQPL